MRHAWIPAVMVTSVALTGCTSDGWTGDLADAAGSAAGNAIEEATGGDVSVNLGDGASVPSDWPESVPVPAMELSAAAVTGSGWTAAATGPSLAFDDYVEELEMAGFEAAGGVAHEDAARSDKLSDGTHDVVVVWAKEPGGDSGLLTITVTPV